MPEYLSQTIAYIQNELRKVIVGQDGPIEQILVALLAEGHALIEGVPGTAKTLTVKTLARIVNAGFGRIQFTPDLMPSDITGTNVFNMGSSSFSLRRGPIFTDILLADEINRTPPKTQAALLEAMEEHQVVARWDAGFNARRLNQVDIQPLAAADTIIRCRAEVNNMHMEPGVQRYDVDIVRRTRDHPALHYGASPRAAVALLLCAKALSAIRGRDFSTPDAARRITPPL